MRMLSVVLVFALGLAFGACHDAVAPVATTLAPPTPHVQALAAEHGSSWLQPGSEPFACFVSTSTGPGAPSRYRYHRVRLRLPRNVRSETGAVVAYQYRLVRKDGTMQRAVNCIIPRTAGAWDYLNRRLGVRAELVVSGPVALEATCVRNPDGSEGTCGLVPLVVIGEPGGREPDPEPECTLNGCTGGSGIVPSTGGAGTGPGGDPYSGGENPCTTCGPQAPTLACTSVVREQDVTCTISTGTTQVKGYGWKFTGNGHTITGPSGVATWSGRAVQSGTVTAMAESDLANPLTGVLDVQPRNWRWGAAKWSYSAGAAWPCDTRVPAPGVSLGWNIKAGDTTCNGLYHLRVQPDPRFDTSGYVVTSVPQGGPNGGMFYVDSVTFRMDRSSNVNLQTGGGGTAMPLTGRQALTCGPAANFAAFNACKGVNMPAFLAAVWSHEGMGTNGNNGHESTARYAANLLSNDPYHGTEDKVSRPGESEVAFRQRVGDEAVQRGQRINSYSSDASGNVTGNWSGQFWIWDHAWSQFVSITQTF